MPKGYYQRHPKPKICGIYAVLNTETGETYIGSSPDVRGRYWSHLTRIRRGKHKESILNAAKEYGIEVFTLVILEECSVEDLYQKETEWLQANKPEYNVLFEASPKNKGLKREPTSDKTKELISQANKGHPGYWLGKHHSEQTKVLLSKISSERRHTEESRLLMSDRRREYWAKRKSNETT